MTVASWNQLDAWLAEQDRGIATLVAFRSVLRAWPMVTRHRPGDAGWQVSVLQSGRALLLAGNAIRHPGKTKSPGQLISLTNIGVDKGSSVSAAQAAALASQVILEAAFSEKATPLFRTQLQDATRLAADAINNKASGRDDVSAAIAATTFNDTSLEMASLMTEPLWHRPAEPNWLKALSDGVTDTLDTGAEWQFWQRWYAAWLSGIAMDQKLLVRIAAEIEPDVWEAGADEVSLAIMHIERDERTGIGPRMRRNSSGLWDLEDDVIIPEEPVDFAIGQVEVALSVALSGAVNGINENSDETRLCREAFKRRDNPSVVASQFWSACMGIERNIKNGWYPEDTAHLGLRNTLFTSVEELCEQDELVRDRIGRLIALEPRRDPTNEEREELRKVPDEMRGQMTERAQKALEETVEVVTDSEKPPRSDRVRIVNWLNTMGQNVDKGMKVEKRANWLAKLASRIAGWFFNDS